MAKQLIDPTNPLNWCNPDGLEPTPYPGEFHWELFGLNQEQIDEALRLEAEQVEIVTEQWNRLVEEKLK